MEPSDRDSYEKKRAVGVSPSPDGDVCLALLPAPALGSYLFSGCSLII